ncbi:hypothetical protein HanPSC8_Chr03g0105841 [Helianthus annuus]|nr:hypothetical protein HanPSC8_Chr03g0105841 [Helianthus annuus]
MDVTSKHDINLVLYKPRLVHYSHAFTFHIVIVVAVVPWSVQQDDQPWSLGSVNFR